MIDFIFTPIRLTLRLAGAAIVVVAVVLVGTMLFLSPAQAEPVEVVTIKTDDAESMRAFHELRGRIFLTGTPGSRSPAAFKKACKAKGYGAFIGEAEPPEPKSPLSREYYCLSAKPPEKKEAEFYCAIAALAMNLPLFLEPNWRRGFTVRCMAPLPKGKVAA